MVARSVWTMLASLPGAEVVALDLMGVVAATLEVVETRAMGVAGMTVGLEDMAMDMEDPETMVAEARVVMTATQEEITETIMTTEMRHTTPNVDTQNTRNKTSDPGSSFQMAVFIKSFGAALKQLF